MTAPILDPRYPPRIFDGKLDVYSTCRDCGKIMKVVLPEQHSHPGCITVQTEHESLADLLASEMLRDDIESAKLTRDLMNQVAELGIGDAATQYGRWMWPVFPLAKHGKQPAIPKHLGGNGFKDATTDLARIERRWTRHPDDNIGLATGHMFDVIDVDTKDKDGNPSPKGVMSLMDSLDDGVLPTCHGIAVTASGGLHLYVKPTGKGNRAGVRPGIDYRGKGGYVVAPPSTLGTPGRQYAWLTEPSPIIKGDF